MAIIGTFTASGDGFTGMLRTLALKAEIHIEPVESPSERGPDYRLLVDGVEFGAGWKRISRDGERDYLSVKFDDPTWTNPVFASLVASHDPDIFHLIWSRPLAT
ncbi:MAG: DUF736 domain-containing protein [Asticcacaulis sp.]|uniref:DUF736 domain-containing protein n=1 Tax=Asticcacaulis sp. TaxID=1872648 RepID=UPI0039E2A909